VASKEGRRKHREYVISPAPTFPECVLTASSPLSVVPSNCLQILTTDDYPYRVMAFLSCDLSVDVCHVPRSNSCFSDVASTDDANEISFEQNELLDIADFQGRLAASKKADGTEGSATFPAFFLVAC